MIDVVREVNAFKPIDLTRIPEEYKPATEQMRTSFILYNKALHEIQIGHDDAAKNFLRKAVTLFPEFYDAIMVLGILVFSNGDRIGAVRIFNSVKDLEQRAISIGILDHLVEEAEKPETIRSNESKRTDSSRGKAESVMGGMAGTGVRPRRNTDTVQYSKGQVFEKSNSYYEPQPRRSSYTSKPLHHSAEDDDDNDNQRAIRRAPQRSVQNPAPRGEMRAENTNTVRSGSRDVKDISLLNKYLLIVIAILLIFSVVVSTLLINKMASERHLRNELEAFKSAASSPAPADNTPAPGTPGATP